MDGPGDTSWHARRALAGIRESLEYVAARFLPFLVAQAEHDLQGRLRDLYDPQDLVHTTWERVLPRLGAIDLGERGAAGVLMRYLSRTLSHLVIELRRRSIRERLRPNGGRASESAGIEKVAADDTSVTARVVASDTYRELLRTLLELPESDRDVLILRVVKGLPNDQAAQLLGVSQDVVSQRLHRARVRLATSLPEDFVALLD